MKTLTIAKIKEALETTASAHYGESFSELNERQRYRSIVRVVRDYLSYKRKEFNKQFKTKGTKRVHYISMEFLLGKSLKNNLFNLGLEEKFESLLKNDYSIDLKDVYDYEPDAGLGNGGLGRLAACYMDSLASMSYPAMGHCLFFDYGLFTQKIVNGWQTELPDGWLINGGDVWFRQRSDKLVTVKFDGTVVAKDVDGKTVYSLENYNEVEALPYDMVLSGYKTDGVAVLRLWQAHNKKKFDMTAFSQGKYMAAMQSDNEAELLTKVLYPSDNHEVGKELRLKQEYFLCSASMQNVVADHYKTYKTLDNFASMVAVHINDTHPALCIPELMRIFMDDYDLEWDKAWNIVKNVCAYTNHTVMAEALECWPEFLIQKTLPRIYQIILEINKRICSAYYEHCNDLNKVTNIAVVAYGQIRMANLAVTGSHSVNGVSALHSEIIKKSQFADFYSLEPKRFTNVTNGVAYRRWLCQNNPQLSALLYDCIGAGFLRNANELEKFLKFRDDESVLKRLEEIKYQNKCRMAEEAKKYTQTSLDPLSVFDVQAKRLHEYKRQLLNVLKIISLYHDIKENPEKPFTPRTYIFAAKAAPSYFIAKEIIKLIYFLGKDIEANPVTKGKLTVAFLENYCVTMAESLIPSTDVSEQISLAGKEASGTGNMKFMFNGALTLGTLDGANVEINEAVGSDNIFIFGMTEKKVEALWKKGYYSTDYYLKNSALRAVVEEMNNGFYGQQFDLLASYLLKGNPIADPFMCFADFADYSATSDKVYAAYEDKKKWQQMSLTNIAKAGRFSSDYSVEEYVKKIWKINK